MYEEQREGGWRRDSEVGAIFYGRNSICFGVEGSQAVLTCLSAKSRLENLEIHMLHYT